MVFAIGTRRRLGFKFSSIFGHAGRIVVAIRPGQGPGRGRARKCFWGGCETERTRKKKAGPGRGVSGIEGRGGGHHCKSQLCG